MALYGTEAYYKEKAEEATIKCDLIANALVRKATGLESRRELYMMCKVYAEAYEDHEALEEKLNEYCKHAQLIEEGAEV